MAQKRVKKMAEFITPKGKFCYYIYGYTEQDLRSMYSYELHFNQSLKATAYFS